MKQDFTEEYIRTGHEQILEHSFISHSEMQIRPQWLIA